MSIEALLPEATIEAFDLGIVGRPTWPAEIQLHAAFIRPFVHDLGNEFAAVINLNRRWQAAMRSYPVQCVDHILSL